MTLLLLSIKQTSHIQSAGMEDTYLEEDVAGIFHDAKLTTNAYHPANRHILSQLLLQMNSTSSRIWDLRVI